MVGGGKGCYRAVLFLKRYLLKKSTNALNPGFLKMKGWDLGWEPQMIGRGKVFMSRQIYRSERHRKKTGHPLLLWERGGGAAGTGSGESSHCTWERTVGKRGKSLNSRTQQNP